MFESIRRLFRPKRPHGLGQAGVSMSVVLPTPVKRGSAIYVQVTAPALDVTDSLGNSYRRLGLCCDDDTLEEWHTITQHNGQTVITAEWEKSRGLRMFAEEWR